MVDIVLRFVSHCRHSGDTRTLVDQFAAFSGASVTSCNASKLMPGTISRTAKRRR